MESTFFHQKEDWINPKIDLFQNSISGYGLFALERIKKDEAVIVYGNNYLTKEEIDLYSRSHYIIQWDDDLFSAEIPQEEEGWFINHSCNPNTWMKTSDPYTLVAMRTILPGEEINVDYAIWNDHSLESFDCNCGNENCRKKITPHDWRIVSLQKKYKNHFCPFLLKKIASKRRVRQIK